MKSAYISQIYFNVHIVKKNRNYQQRRITRMNQFFLKPLLNSSPTNEQSDYDRLLKLCESYGLNEEETQQLMDEFKKGGYDKSNSMKSSLNQSLMSDHYSQPQNPPPAPANQQKPILRTHSDTFYQHRQYQNSLANPSKSTDRYYGYQEQHQHGQPHYQQQRKTYHDDEISYNEMTFNHEQENLEKFNSGEVDVRLMGKGSGYGVGDVGKRLKGNDSKASLAEKQSQNPQSVPHSQRNSVHHQSSPNQSVSSTHSQNSHHSIENPQLNPVYVKQLIYNFQLLEKQNDYLKQQNSSLQKQQKAINNQHQGLKKELEQVKKQRDQFKTKSLMLQNENFQLKSVLDNEKNKNQTFKQIKQRDSQIIQGLKDSIIQFTSILKEKDTRNHELQNKLILAYEKNEKLSHQIYSTGQTQNNDNTLQKIIEKLGSKKSLTSKNEAKQQRINIQNQVRRQQWKQTNQNDSRKQLQIKREKGRNHTRRQLGEILMNNQQNHEMVVNQSNKQLVRETSTAKIGQSENEQHNVEKPTISIPRRPTREVKENVFVGVEVETGDHGKVLGSKRVFTEEDSKRRSSSRVDIRKYKGMIEDIRNNYSNIPGNMIR